MNEKKGYYLKKLNDYFHGKNIEDTNIRYKDMNYIFFDDIEDDSKKQVIGDQK